MRRTKGKKAGQREKKGSRSRKVGGKKFVRTSITFSREVWEELKVMSIREGKPLGDVITQILKEYKRLKKLGRGEVI